MNTRLRGITALLTGLVLISATACAQTSPGATSTPSDPASSSSVPSTSPEPSTSPTADPADPTTWIITTDGIGPIEIGAQLPSTLAMLPSDWTNDDNCSWTAWWNAPDAGYGVMFVRGTQSPTDPIMEMSVYTAVETPMAVPSPVTAEGLGIGATKAEVLKAYPDAVEGDSLIGGGSWLRLASSGEAHIFFEYREGVVGASDVAVTTAEQPAYEVCG